MAGPLSPEGTPVMPVSNEVPYGEAQELDAQAAGAPLPTMSAVAPPPPSTVSEPSSIPEAAVNDGQPTSYLPQWGNAGPAAAGQRPLSATESVAVAILGMGQSTPTARRFALAMLGEQQPAVIEPIVPPFTFPESLDQAAPPAPEIEGPVE